ncbi:hypothetical protein L798_01410 [Zootermopsis nevadensis]|uniref:Uncharacterized protein n=1 Tax=Zootermopsis nevadensis TaxID=136037 RepID=A0A067QTF1_ZOONE|nr:hypothetical protein L798_01410 [Zootermopsis nevadensis]
MAGCVATHDVADLLKIFNYETQLAYRCFQIQRFLQDASDFMGVLVVSVDALRSFAGRLTIFEFGANLIMYQRITQRSSYAPDKQDLFSEFNITLPFSEPQQRNQILLLCCLPSLLHLTQHDLRNSSKHVPTRSQLQ